jgi:hypothetical protein
MMNRWAVRFVVLWLLAFCGAAAVQAGLIGVFGGFHGEVRSVVLGSAVLATVFASGMSLRRRDR